MEHRIKILIVEDEALIADEIRRTATGLGYEVAGICYDYASAAGAVLDTDADLIMLDINLGGGSKEEDGIALAGLIRANRPRPFIFLTAYSDTGTIARATALHPANYLIKPVAPAMLFAAIQLSIANILDPEPGQPAPGAGQPDFFYVKVGSRTTKLYWEDVFLMETAKNYVRIHTTAQPGDYPIRGTLNFVLDKLVPEPLRARFFRLGRNLCLNRNHVTSFSTENIVCGDRTFENGGRISEAQFRALAG